MKDERKTKKQLIDEIAHGTDGTQRAVGRTIQAFLDAIIVELGRGNRLELRDFGVFEIQRRSKDPFPARR